MEIKTEIKYYKVDLLCDKCRNGYLVCNGDGEGNAKDGVKYKHVCDECGDIQEILEKIYPDLRHEEVTN